MVNGIRIIEKEYIPCKDKKGHFACTSSFTPTPTCDRETGGVRVIDKSTGEWIATYVPDILPPCIIGSASKELGKYAKKSGFRGVASGKLDPDNIMENVSNSKNIKLVLGKDSSWCKIIRPSGSSTWLSNYVESGNVGYYKNKRTGKIRNPKNTSENTSIFLNLIGDILKQYEPDLHDDLSANVPENMKYCGSPFTTITINHNFRTAYHTDNGNYADLGILCSYGEFEGGALHLPEYNIAFALKPGDLLIGKTGKYLHGNFPFTGDRMSFVFYARKNLVS